MVTDIAVYQSQEASASLVTEKTGLAPSDLALLLYVSAGTITDVLTGDVSLVYRPYYVAAKLLATRRTQLTEAEGTKFVDPLKVAEEYLRLQAAMDKSLGLAVPEGAEAVMETVIRTTPVSGTVRVVGTW